VRVSGEVVPGDGPGARSSPDLVTRIVTLRQATGEAEGGGGYGVGFMNNKCVYSNIQRGNNSSHALVSVTGDSFFDSPAHSLGPH
jgi:hypothetical protein